MKGMAAATVPAVSATPLAAACGCPSRTISSACVRPASGALPAGIPVYIGSAAPGSAFDTTVVRRKRVRQQGRTRLTGDR
jgi:hypothetical protein